jgi:hypothetical protein
VWRRFSRRHDCLIYPPKSNSIDTEIGDHQFRYGLIRLQVMEVPRVLRMQSTDGNSDVSPRESQSMGRMQKLLDLKQDPDDVGF